MLAGRSIHIIYENELIARKEMVSTTIET